MKINTLATNLLLLALLSGCGKPTPPSASKSAPPAISIQDAARTGNLEAIQQHIQATSNLNEKAPDSGGSPLHTAAVFGQLEAVRALVQAGADVNARNNDGATPLLVAVAVPLGVRAAGARLPLPLSGFLDDNITTRFEEFRNLIDMIRC
jgi:ankyrin repeat protein